METVFFGVATHPTLDRVAIVVGAGTAVQIWEPGAAEPMSEYPLTGTVENVEFTASGDRLITFGNDDQVTVILQVEFRDVMTEGMSLTPRIRYVDNDSDVPLYSYDRIEIGVMLRWMPQ